MLNFGKFLTEVQQIVTGCGFKKVLPISIYDAHLQSSGAQLTTTLTTNPGFDKIGTNMTALSWAAAKVVEAGLTVQIPDDYDSASDHCKLLLKAYMSGSTDTPSIDAKVYVDSASTTDLDPTKSAALGATADWVEIDISDNDLSAGDVVQFALFPETHGTDAVIVQGIKLEYKSNLVYTDADERHSTDTYNG